jgi:hypothetical protein
MNAKPQQLHDFAMYLDHQWYRLTAREGSYTTDPIGRFRCLGTPSMMSWNLSLASWTSERISESDFRSGGIRGLGPAGEKRVDGGEMAVAFALYPVSLQQLMDIADSGNAMPPKLNLVPTQTQRRAGMPSVLNHNNKFIYCCFLHTFREHYLLFCYICRLWHRICKMRFRLFKLKPPIA